MRLLRKLPLKLTPVIERKEWHTPEELPYSCFRQNLDRYIFASPYGRGKLVLDLGCSTGYGAECLATRGASFVVAGDREREALFYAKKRYPSGKIAFLNVDALALPFKDRSFDVVVCFEVIEHLAAAEPLLSECHRVLKEAGLFICSTPNKAVSIPWKFHIREYSAPELRSLLERYFSNIVVYSHHGGTFYRTGLGRVRSLWRRALRRLPVGRRREATLERFLFYVLNRYLEALLFRRAKQAGQQGLFYDIVPFESMPNSGGIIAVATASKDRAS